MNSYYGVQCKACQRVIRLGSYEPDNDGQISFYTTPLDAVQCKACGSSYLYGSGDLGVFVEEESTLQLGFAPAQGD